MNAILTIELEVEIEGPAAYRPAVIRADPDASHDDESYAEVVRATWNDVDLTDLIKKHFAAEAEQALVEAAAEDGR